MLNNSKVREYMGILHNLMAKIQGYPLLLIWLELKRDYTLVIDMLNHTITPPIMFKDVDNTYIQLLFTWYDKELVTRKIISTGITQCEVSVLIEAKKWLFIPYHIAHFELKALINEQVYTKSYRFSGMSF